MAVLYESIFRLDREGLKKVLSGYLGQVDFPAWQVTFHSHLPNGQGLKQVICQLNHKTKINTCPGQVKFESCLFNGQAGMQVFFPSPVKQSFGLFFTLYQFCSNSGGFH